MNRHLNDFLLLSAAEALRMQKTYLKTRFHLCKCPGFGLKWASVCSDAFKLLFFSFTSALVLVPDAAGLFSCSEGSIQGSMLLLKCACFYVCR